VKLLTPSLLLCTSLLFSCSTEPQPQADQAMGAGAEQPVANGSAPASTPNSITGAVLETMNAGGYTYALIDTGADKLWAAGPETSAKVGDRVSATGLMTMRGFESKTLERTFDVIYFAAALSGADADIDVSAFHTAGQPTNPDAAASTISVEAAAGGQTVEDIFLKRDELVGKQVVIRAEVVKFNADIMKTNWIHIQDGSGSAGTNDLTVTTDATLEVGDMVEVRGILIADKDFGFGYKYELIIEDAAVTPQ
jgi:hypothetical protein